MLGAEVVKPVNHAVPLPAGFPAQLVSLPGPGYAIAGWWVNQGGDSPIVLLLHSIRAELFRAGAQPKRLWVVNGARHRDFLVADPTGYDSQVIGFLREYLRPAA